MADRNQKVFDRVLNELQKKPDLGSKDLYGIAQGVDKAISEDSLQQFHARYVLPAKRELRRGGGAAPADRQTAPRGRRAEKAAATEEAPAPKQRRSRRSRTEAQSGSQRDLVRSALLQFAQELTDAESRSDLVKVLGRVDSYVDRVVAAKE